MNGKTKRTDAERNKLSFALELAAKKHSLSPAELVKVLQEKGCPEEISSKLRTTFSLVGSSIQLPDVSSTFNLPSSSSSDEAAPESPKNVEVERSSCPSFPTSGQPIPNYLDYLAVLAQMPVQRPANRPVKPVSPPEAPSEVVSQPVKEVMEVHLPDAISPTDSDIPFSAVLASDFVPPAESEVVVQNEQQNAVPSTEVQSREPVVVDDALEQAVEEVLFGKGIRAAATQHNVDRDVLRATLIERGCQLGPRPLTPPPPSQIETETPDQALQESGTALVESREKPEGSADEGEWEIDEGEEEEAVEGEGEDDDDGMGYEEAEMDEQEVEMEEGEGVGMTLNLLVANPAPPELIITVPESQAEDGREATSEPTVNSENAAFPSCSNANHTFEPGSAMAKAIDEVEYQVMTAYAAAKLHNVPYAALKHILLSRGLIDPKTQLHPIQQTKAVLPKSRKPNKPKLNRPRGKPKLAKTQTIKRKYKTQKIKPVVRENQRPKSERRAGRPKRLMTEEETEKGEEGKTEVEEQEVQAIEEVRSVRQYLVKWQGESQPQWVDESFFVGLTRAPSAVQE